MFIGEYHHSVDEKGRLIIPSKLRDDLGEHFILTRGLDGCLFIYPNNEWNNVINKYKELPNVKVIVEDCAFTSILEEFYCVAKLFVGFKPKLLIKSSERFAKKKLGIDYTTLSPIKSVANAKYPMMFVHGKDDAFIPCVSANLLYDACPTEKELLLIDDFGHASSQLAGDNYYGPVFGFVDKYCK